MTVSTEIQQIKTSVHATYTALENKGATLPAVESLENLATTVATIPSGGTVGNIYTLSMLEEMEDDIRNSSLIKAGVTEIDIMGTNESLTPIPDTWVFRPANMEERFRDVLTSEHIYAEIKLTEILGEVNE